MEESLKRKERLKAMGMGAAQVELVYANAPTTGNLINPLNQPNSAPIADGTSSSFRFDYYTNPMAAFNGNKRKGSVTNDNWPNNFSSTVHSNSTGAHLPSPFAGPRDTFMTPSPANQFQVQGPHDLHSPSSYSAPWSRPTINQFQLIYSPHQGPHELQSPCPHSAPWSRSTAKQVQLNFSPHEGQCEFQSPSPHSAPWLSSADKGSSFSLHSPVGVLGAQNNFNISSGHGSPYNASWGGVTGSVGQRTTHGAYSGTGNHISYSGRSKNSRFGSDPSPGSHPSWSNSRQKGVQGHVTASENPGVFYNKQMIEDPWDKLEPALGSILVAAPSLGKSDSSKSWLPKSLAKNISVDEITTKKGKVVSTSKDSSSQLNLAQYLAQSFEEAANDETET